MSVASPPRRRPIGSLLGVPEVGDVHPPRWIARRPLWLVAAVLLLVLLALSALLRSRALSGQLWFDEANAVGSATLSLGGVLHAAYVDGSAPLYTVLLHFWIQAVGDDETAVHGLSLLCALLTVPVAGWAGWSLSGPRAALYGAALFAFSSVGTQYAEEAQPYG